MVKKSIFSKGNESIGREKLIAGNLNYQISFQETEMKKQVENALQIFPLKSGRS